MPACSAYLSRLACVLPSILARKPAGAFGIRHSLRPLDFRGPRLMHHSGISCRGNADARHCEERSDEAIHVSASGCMDCFASLAMTAVLFEKSHPEKQTRCRPGQASTASAIQDPLPPMLVVERANGSSSVSQLHSVVMGPGLRQDDGGELGKHRALLHARPTPRRSHPPPRRASACASRR
jgi:hypothetical protein